ncbi:MAG: hypothetical protein Q9219_001124 [cf. Caloplaca sp. 3 TL-2023]
MDLLSTKPPATAPAKVGQAVFLNHLGGSRCLLQMPCDPTLCSLAEFPEGLGRRLSRHFAWLLALCTAIDWQIVARHMFQFMPITSGQLWPPPATFIRDTEKYYKGSIVVNVFFHTSLWAAKFSFLLFFRHLGRNVMGFNILWWTVFAFTAATYLICIGDIQYSCLADPVVKIMSHCSNDSAVRYQHITLKLNCAMDVTTDYMS